MSVPKFDHAHFYTTYNLPVLPHKRNYKNILELIQLMICKTPPIPNTYYARHFSLVVVLILLAACAKPPVPLVMDVVDPYTTWQRRNQGLAGLDEWSAIGRIAIRTDDDAWNVSMRWRQRDDKYRIRLNAPLALGSAEIAGGADGVLLKTTDQGTFFAPDPESLLFDTLGWHLPVKGLRDWILGRPREDAPTDELEIDNGGRLKQLHQSGWVIRYLGYRRVGDIELPTRLKMENARLDAHIRISKWRLPPS